jgi:tetratricopeptide (TPR) repeat protein
MTMAGRSFGTSGFGRAGVNRFGRAVINNGALGLQRNGYGYGYGGYGYGYPSYGGYGGYGYGYPWYGAFGGYGGYGGYGGNGYGFWPWLYGSSLYNWGYSRYFNPYYIYGGYGLGAFGYPGSTTIIVQPAVYDYSQPLSTPAPPPEPAVADKVGTSFDAARDAFKAGDYPKALELTNQLIRQTPNDAALHEFRGMVLLALYRYEDAAVPLYAVLSVRPGWDWKTLVGLYPNVSVYTEQLRALETYCRLNPRSASAHFVLAYLYLTQGNTDVAVDQLKRVAALQPKDTVAARLLEQLDKTNTPAAAGVVGQPPPHAPAPGLAPTAQAVQSPLANEGRLEGTWTAQPDPETTITFNFLGQGRFTWKVTDKGVDRLIEGKLISGNGLLTLAQDNGALIVGNIGWSDETHFAFKVPGAGPDDHGLNFTKSR